MNENVKAMLVGRAVQAEYRVGGRDYSPATKGLLTSKTTLSGLGGIVLGVGGLLALDWPAVDATVVATHLGMILAGAGAIWGRWKASGKMG